MQFFGMSDVGMKRTLNEDNFSVDVAEGVVIALVCDGMGGANAGEVASRIACRSFVNTVIPKLHEIRESVTDAAEIVLKTDRAIYDACEKANSEIYLASKEDNALSGMGTTLSGCMIEGDMLWTFNVGDSRVYHITDKEAKQLTVDHSFVQALIDDGKITPEEAQNHPNRNVILRALGVQSKVECDLGHLQTEGGYYLVCSDGMSNYFDEKEFIRIVSSNKPISEKAEDFIAFANSQGGADNITVVLIDTENPDNGGDHE